MNDPTQLLPQQVLGVLNFFVLVCRVLNHFLGYGWGTLAFLLLTALLAFWWPIARWANKVRPKDGSVGISSHDAQEQTKWHFRIAGVLFAIVNGYVLTHGGMVDHLV